MSRIFQNSTAFGNSAVSHLFAELQAAYRAFCVAEMRHEQTSRSPEESPMTDDRRAEYVRCFDEYEAAEEKLMDKLRNFFDALEDPVEPTTETLY